MASRQKLPVKEVIHPSGERYLSFTPVICSVRRETIQRFLPAGLKGLNIFYGFSPDELECAQRFDVRKAIEEAQKAQAKASLYQK